MAGESILIVDDNMMNLKLAKVLLEGDGYEVQTAIDANQAQAVLKQFRPRLILMDIQLPGMDGLELTRLLKSDPANKDTIVVALTAYAMKGDEEKARNAGCDGYITKPIDTRIFPSQVRQYLAPPETPVAAAPVGDYHDLLTELRNNFLTDGQEESSRLLESLNTTFDLTGGRRISHRWAGVAGTLGYPQLSHKALALETMLDQPGAEKDPQVRAGLEELAQMFADGIRGKLDMPMLSADKDLAGKRFAIVGFEAAEADRIARALEHSQAFTRAIPAEEAGEGAQALLLFDMLIVCVSAQARQYPWMQVDVLKKNNKPLLFVGSREMLSELPPEVQELASDFLVAPWDQDEVVLRARRILSKAAKDAEAGAKPSVIPQLGRPAAAAPENNRVDRKPQVVIADDDPTITALVTAGLRKYGVECHIAHNGAEALALTRKIIPSAVILDVFMPEMDGFEVLANLKRDEKTSMVPVIMLTVRQQSSDVMRGFGFGAEDYVVKPFNPMELAARVSRFLPGTRESRTRVA